MDVVTNRAHAYSFSKGFADGYALLARQFESNTRRAVIILALAIALIVAVLVFPAPAFSNQGNPPTTCTLACDPAKMTCSRYPASQVPGTATQPRSVPSLYKVVPSGTRCDASACMQDPYMCVIGTI